MRLVDRDPARAAAFCELVAEAALAEASLGPDADDLPVARGCPSQRGLQRRNLGIPPDEAREAARPGHVEPRPHRADPLELVDAKRLAEALHVEHPEIAE